MTTPCDYVELRCRSAFSFLAGASLPEDLVDRAAALGYDTLALADRNVVYGGPRFFHAARRAARRPPAARRRRGAGPGRGSPLAPRREPRGIPEPLSAPHHRRARTREGEAGSELGGDRGPGRRTPLSRRWRRRPARRPGGGREPP